MNDLQKDISIGVMMMTGLLGFVSGEFVISSTLFATAAIYTNVDLARKYKARLLSC